MSLPVCTRIRASGEGDLFFIAQTPAAAYDFPGEQTGDDPLHLHGTVFFPNRTSLERSRSSGHRSRGISSASTTPAKEGGRDPASPSGLREKWEKSFTSESANLDLPRRPDPR